MSGNDSDGSSEPRAVGRRTVLQSALSVGALGGYATVASGEESAGRATADTDDELAIEWERGFGGDDVETASDVIQTADGGYLAVGATSSFGSGDTDVYAVKTDASGNREWDRTYGGQSADAGSAVVETSDGGYLVAGRTESYGNGTQSAWLFETDADGRMLWNQPIGQSDTDAGVDVLRTTDDHYLLSYTASTADDEPTAARLAKTDRSGTVQWDERYGGNGSDDMFTATIETSDGGYLSSGVRVGAGSGPTSAWLVKTAASGDQLWERTFGGDQSDSVNSVIETGDGGYLLVGHSDPFGDQQVWLVKTSTEGVVQWNSLLGSGSGVDVVETHDGGFLLTGSTSPTSESQPVYLAKTDGSGTRQWETDLGNGDEQRPSALRTTTSGHVIAGTVDWGDEDGQQLWLANLGGASFPGTQGPPTSLDDDPLLEDIDGDGDGDIFDALTYYNNRDSSLVTNNPRRFDFDGDGTPGTIFDTLELYNKIS